MEMKDVLKKINKNKVTLGVLSILGIVIGIAIYLIPAKYISTGTFYIKRTTEKSNDYFTYEGYYGQQTALSYTNTVAALLESVDLRSKALFNLRLPINEFTLRRYQRLISVKKDGPQLITLAVKGKTFEESRDLWESLSNALIETTAEINEMGDPNLSISKVSTEPVVKKEYKSLWLNATAGAGLGLVLGLLLISSKEYFKK